MHVFRQEELDQIEPYLDSYTEGTCPVCGGHMRSYRFEDTLFFECDQCYISLTEEEYIANFLGILNVNYVDEDEWMKEPEEEYDEEEEWFAMDD